MYKIKFLLIGLLFICCAQKHSYDLNGHWRIHHIIVDDKDLLENEIDHENMFSQGFLNSKLLKIENDSLYFFTERHKKAVKGAISFPEKGAVIIDSKIELLKGGYNVETDTLKTTVGGIKSLDIRVVLKSRDKTIFMNRLEAENKNNWLQKMK